MKHFLLRLSYILIIFFAIVFSILVILVNTEPGSRWLLTRAIQLAPEHIQVGTIEGRLYKTIILKDLKIQTDQATITSDKMAIDWHMTTLLRGKFSLSRFTADTLNIKINKPKRTQKNEASSFSLPMKIHLKEFEIKKLVLESPALSSPFIFNNVLVNAKIYPELLSTQLITQLTSPTTMNIRLDSSGKLDHYQVALVIDQAENRWSLKAEGDSEHLHFHTKQNKILGGTVNLLGDIALGDQFQWLTEVEIKGIHPELLLPDWPGTLNLTLKSRIKENLIDVELTHLKGNLKNRPVYGTFHYQQSPELVQTLLSDLHFGNASIKAQGKLDQQIDLNWSINIPQLEDLLAEFSLSGSIDSQGSLSGSETSPKIKARIVGKNIHLRQHDLGNVEAHIAGSEQELAFQYNAEIKDTKLKLQASGPIKDTAWNAQLKVLSIESPIIHHWTLQSPTAFSLSPEAVRLEPLCLIKDKNSFCLNSDWKKGSALRADIKANKIPLELLNPWLGDMSLRGDLNINATLMAVANKTPSLDLNLNLTPGVFYYTLDEIQKPFHYQGGQISAELNQDHFKVKADVELLQNSKFLMKVYTDPAHWKPERWLNNPIHGDFQITAPQLDFLAGLIPSISGTRGSATGNGTITGSLSHPIVSGSAKVNDASFTIPDVNGSIRKLSATGSLHDWVLSYQGTGMAGEGSFNISGTTQVIKKQVHTHLDLHGKNMLISDTPGVKVFATPDLQMKIVDKVMLLTGKIFIPKGEFRSYDYNDTLELPDEISYRQATPLKPENEEPVQLTSSIDLSLGNNISIDSNGLKGKLTGHFAIRDVPGGATTAQGTLVLSNGKYDFRGQTLTVEKGVLNFNGGPVNNPNLNVRTVRYIGTFGAIRPTAINDQNRVVGIYITGTLAKHKLTLFSEPDDISQSDILSYLVLGQSVGSVSGSSGNATALLGAAQALNLTDTGGTLTKLKSQLEQKLGLSEMDITSYETKSKVLNKSTPESTIQHTAFVLGRYLSPKLYVNYSFDILDHTNVFRIRYFLNKKWSVQSESSWEGNALDILYSFERG